MAEKDPQAVLKKLAEKIEKGEKRQAELEEKNDELEKKVAEMEELLNPGDEDEEKKTEPVKVPTLEPVEPATHNDPVHEWAKKQMTAEETKKKKVKEKFRVKSKAEIEADADKLFQEMLLDGQE